MGRGAGVDIKINRAGGGGGGGVVHSKAEGLIFTAEVFILMQKSMWPRGSGAMNFGMTKTLV